MVESLIRIKRSRGPVLVFRELKVMLVGMYPTVDTVNLTPWVAFVAAADQPLTNIELGELMELVVDAAITIVPPPTTLTVAPVLMAPPEACENVPVVSKFHTAIAVGVADCEAASEASCKKRRGRETRSTRVERG